MKTYNALVIADKDVITILYECDNKMNIQCKGHENCRECHYTTDVKYAKDISNEKTRLELKEDLKEKQEEIEQHKETIRRMISGEEIFCFRTLNYLRKIFNLNPIE